MTHDLSPSVYVPLVHLFYTLIYAGSCKKKKKREGSLVETFKNPGLRAVGLTPCLEATATQGPEAVFVTAEANPAGASRHRCCISQEKSA